MDPFVQNMAESYGYQRDPQTGALSQPGPAGHPLTPPQVNGKVIADPQMEAMMTAMEQAAQKRKENHWPEKAAVVHPGSGQVIAPNVAAVRD